MKKIIAVLLVLISLLSLMSCSDRKTLTVKVVGKEGTRKLYESELPPPGTLTLAANDITIYRVLIVDGELWLSSEYNETGHYLMSMNNGYFSGIGLGHFGGHCKYYQYNIDTEGTLVTAENCYGMFEKSPMDFDNGYIISGIWNMKTTGASKIHRVYKVGINWEWEVIAQFESVPRSYLYDHENGELYVVTYRQLLKISLEDGTVKVLSEHEAIDDDGANSMVKLENKLFIGMFNGLMEYDLETDEAIWYSPKIYG